MRTYLVGGAVRDMLLNRPVKDRDWVVVGATPQEMLDAGFTQVGADFPVFLHPHTKEEYALARTERKTGHGYHGFTTIHDHTVTLEQDLERRDLTMNAMAIEDKDVMDFKMTGDAALLVDPFHGAADLELGMIRHVSDAFQEDPVRVLRVARFAARYDFNIAENTGFLMRKMAADGVLDHLVPERVWAEFEKALMEPHPDQFFGVLDHADALEKTLPFFGVAQFPQVQDVCDDFTDEMAARHRAAAVLALCTVHLATKDPVDRKEFDGRRKDLFDRCRVPNDVRRLVDQLWEMTFKPAGVTFGTAPFWLDRLKALGWYRDERVMFDLRRVLPPYQWAVQQWEALHKAWQASHMVTFADLTDEQKATLKGAAVGEAIDELRMEKLRKLEFKEKLSGHQL